jgi:hypothetical protein
MFEKNIQKQQNDALGRRNTVQPAKSGAGGMGAQAPTQATGNSSPFPPLQKMVSEVVTSR